VNTSTTPHVDYHYSEMAGGANHSRLTALVYPNGREIDYGYGAAGGLDDRISRLDAVMQSGATLESLQYLGLSQVVARLHPLSGVDETFIKRAGEPNGEAGDQYAGLDRFGREVDVRWVKADGSATDRFGYGYDRDGNPLFKLNQVNTGQSELYHPNGAGQGYDSLNQQTAFARGTLNGSNDTIASPSHSQGFSIDAVGNFASVTTDGNTQTRASNQRWCGLRRGRQHHGRRQRAELRVQRLERVGAGQAGLDGAGDLPAGRPGPAGDADRRGQHHGPVLLRPVAGDRGASRRGGARP